MADILIGLSGVSVLGAVESSDTSQSASTNLLGIIVDTMVGDCEPGFEFLAQSAVCLTAVGSAISEQTLGINISGVESLGTAESSDTTKQYSIDYFADPAFTYRDSVVSQQTASFDLSSVGSELLLGAVVSHQALSSNLIGVSSDATSGGLDTSQLSVQNVSGVSSTAFVQAVSVPWQYTTEDYFSEEYTGRFEYSGLSSPVITGAVNTFSTTQTTRLRINGNTLFVSAGDPLTSQTLTRTLEPVVSVAQTGEIKANQFTDIAKYRTKVENQFPEYYQKEFPQLITFVKKYYEFLDTQTGVNSFRSIKDIDATLDQFIVNLKTDFAKNIPEFGRLGDRRFLAFAKEFYASRGSEDSYHFLFRAMFGKEVELYYPNQSILKASDGKWQQEISIRIQSPNDLLLLSGNDFKLKSSSGQFIAFKCTVVSKIAAETYDVFVDRFFEGKVTVGDEFVYSHDGSAFSGVVIPTLGKASAIQGGEGFKAGQFFSVEDAPTKPIRLKITKVGEFGEVLSAKVVQPGVLSGVRYAILDKNSSTAIQQSSSVLPLPTTSRALVKIEETSSLKYPGFYSTTSGFLSDEIKLHDSYYYQAFSYVVRLDEQIANYKSAVLQLVHPAGMEMFGEYSVSSELEVQPEYRSTGNTTNVLDIDTVEPFDSIDVGHDIYDEVDSRDSVDVGRELYETIDIEEGIVKQLDRSFQETVNISSEFEIAYLLEFATSQDATDAQFSLDVERSLATDSAIADDVLKSSEKPLSSTTEPTSSTAKDYSTELASAELVADSDQNYGAVVLSPPIQKDVVSAEFSEQVADDKDTSDEPFAFDNYKPLTDEQIIASRADRGIDSFAEVEPRDPDHIYNNEDYSVDYTYVTPDPIRLNTQGANVSSQTLSSVLSLLKTSPQTYVSLDYFSEEYMNEQSSITV